MEQMQHSLNIILFDKRRLKNGQSLMKKLIIGIDI